MTIEYPPAFLTSTRALLGPEFDTFLNALREPPVTSVRLNPFKAAPFEGEIQVPWCPQGRYLNERPSFTLDPRFHGGTYYVQEASSMFLHQIICQCIGTDQPLNILDLCAAPGGKSTLLAGLVNPDSLMVANEVIRSRAGILSENLTKWGTANTVVTNNDPRDFSRLEGFFDLIIVDAPCSGEGLFRKETSAISEWSENNIQLCAQRQQRILSDVWPSLKEGGLLVYCTCTYNTLENEDNLRWLAANQDVEFTDVNVDPSWGIHVLDDKVKGMRFLPHRARGEGFFIAAIRKLGSSGTPSRIKKGPVTTTSRIKDQVRDWLRQTEAFEFIQHHENVVAIPAERFNDIAQVLAHLHVIHAGTTIAAVKQNKLVPDHALALSVHLNRAPFAQIELDYDQAVAYLRKEAIHPVAGARGFGLVSFGNTSLGWINQLGTRANNLYPTEWRIRMV